jgi:hypothetical protein
MRATTRNQAKTSRYFIKMHRHRPFNRDAAIFPCATTMVAAASIMPDAIDF